MASEGVTIDLDQDALAACKNRSNPFHVCNAYCLEQIHKFPPCSSEPLCDLSATPPVEPVQRSSPVVEPVQQNVESPFFVGDTTVAFSDKPTKVFITDDNINEISTNVGD
ncbi:hypothetical protein SUGI_0853800 [Cryptomeria japonica]|nr:hypothetical protein SUGI_0853800 [Cryptomeria japonica]